MQNNYNWNGMQDSENYGYSGDGMYVDDTEQKVVIRGFMVMFTELLIMAVSAVFIAHSMDKTDEILQIYEMWLVTFAAGILSYAIAEFALVKRNIVLAVVFCILFSFLAGVTISAIFTFNNLQSVRYVFFVAAALFAGAALFGATVHIDMTQKNTILGMFLIGVVVISIINISAKSTGMDYIWDYIILAIFSGYAAYNTHKIKNLTGGYMTDKEINITALYFGMQMFLDFLTIFLILIKLIGSKKR